MLHMKYQGIFSPGNSSNTSQKRTVHFVMVGVLRVKIKAVSISKPFQAPDKRFFDTDMI